MRLTKAVARLIHGERVSRVATVGPGAMPHVVPVCHAVVDGKICFASGKDGRKVKNLRDNPRVALTVDLYSESWGRLAGVMVQGKAALVEKGPRFRALRAALYAKYQQYPDEAALDESDSVIVEVTPSRMFSWGLE